MNIDISLNIVYIVCRSINCIATSIYNVIIIEHLVI